MCCVLCDVVGCVCVVVMGVVCVVLNMECGVLYVVNDVRLCSMMCVVCCV